jgi:hypothetical protein
MNTSFATRRHEPSWYEIRIQGRLDHMTSACLDGMIVQSSTDGTTLIWGLVTDQAELQGLLSELCAFGLPLLSVAQVELDRRRTLPTPAPTMASRTPETGMSRPARLPRLRRRVRVRSADHAGYRRLTHD